MPPPPPLHPLFPPLEPLSPHTRVSADANNVDTILMGIVSEFYRNFIRLELVLVRLAVARALDLVLPEVGRPLPLLPLRHRLEVPGEMRDKSTRGDITREERARGGEEDWTAGALGRKSRNAIKQGSPTKRQDPGEAVLMSSKHETVGEKSSGDCERKRGKFFLLRCAASNVSPSS